MREQHLDISIMLFIDVNDGSASIKDIHKEFNNLRPGYVYDRLQVLLNENMIIQYKDMIYTNIPL